MKALTICQPYATLIIRGDKRVENRTWAPPEKLIGERIAIHAGKSLKYMAIDPEVSLTQEAAFGLLLDDIPFGAIIGTAKLVGSLYYESKVVDGHYGDRDIRLWNLRPNTTEFCDYVDVWVGMHKHAEGPVCWVLEDVEPCEPIPCKGMQGLWTVPEAIVEQLG